MAKRIHKRKTADSPERMTISQYLSSFSGPIMFFLVVVATIFVMSVFFRITTIPMRRSSGLSTLRKGTTCSSLTVLLP